MKNEEICALMCRTQVFVDSEISDRRKEKYYIVFGTIVHENMKEKSWFDTEGNKKGWKNFYKFSKIWNIFEESSSFLMFQRPKIQEMVENGR